MNVAYCGRAQDDAAPPAQVLFTGLDLELLQRLIDRGGGEVGIKVASITVIDGAIGEDQQLGAAADLFDCFLFDPLDRALR